MVILKKTIIFQDSRYPTFSQGEGQLFPEGGGGVQLLFTIEIYKPCDFPGKGFRTPCPLWLCA